MQDVILYYSTYVENGINNKTCIVINVTCTLLPESDMFSFGFGGVHCMIQINLQ